MSSTLPNPPSSGSSTAPLPPPRVPDHQLIRRIGRGAYGEVWLARCAIGAYRAVKIVHRQSFDHDRPFEREFEGILKFEPVSRTHDSQVDILHVGRGDGCFYYVMELADDQATGGQINPDNYSPRTLKSDLLFHGRLPFEECVRIGIALATALEHLHANGLVHRDVKPSNIIFVNGVPKLADIGLVTGVDATRSYVGTEGFAPPEGSGSPQADIYSLGKVLYELATGKDRQEFPDLPTQLRELPDREGLMELNAVIAKACRHDPKDRYESAAAMRADLELLQSGKSLARLRRTEARLRFVQQAGAVVTALAALIAAGWLWQARQTHLVRDLAAEKTKLVDENRERLLQFDLGNGLREMESGDIGSAMVWLADGLKYATNDPVQAEMYRLRLSLLLQLHPKPLAVIPVGSKLANGMLEDTLLLSQNGRRMVLYGGGRLELWEVAVPPRRLIVVTNSEIWPKFSLSHDGQRLALYSPSRPGQQIWTVDSSGNVQMAEMNDGVLKHFRFVLGGQYVVAENTNHALLMFEAASGKRVGELARLDTPIACLEVSENGDRLSVGVSETNDLVRVLELPSGRQIGEVRIHDTDSFCLLSAKGRYLNSFPNASSKSHASVQIWDAANGRPVGRQPSPFDPRQGVPSGLSPDERLLAIGDVAGKVYVMNQFTGDPLMSLLLRERTCNLRFSEDSACLATGDWAGLARVWDARTGRQLTPALTHFAPCIVDFAMNGAALITHGADGLARMWDLTSMEAPITTLETPSTVLSIRFSPDGALLLARCSRSSFVWSTRDWRLLATIQHSTGQSDSAEFSPDSRYVAVADRSQGARVWDARTGQPAGPPLRHGTNFVVDVSFSPDQQVLATAGYHDRLVRLWDWREGIEVHAPLQHTGVVKAVEFCTTGNRLVTVSFESDRGRGILWDWQAGKIVLRAHSRDLKRGWWQWLSPDGTKWLFGAPDVFTALLVDTATGKYLPSRIAHEDSITHLMFSPDGKRILTGGFDKTVRVWDAATGEPALPPLKLDGSVREAHFSHDGRMIGTLTAKGAFQLWDATTGLPLTPSMPMGVHGASRFKFHPDNRRLAVCLGFRRIAIYNLQTDLPAEHLEEFVRLTTGRSVGTNGRIERVPPEELLALDARLRSAYAEQFTLPEQRQAGWHEAQINEYGRAARLDSSLYHVERWLELEPGNTQAREIKARLEARRIPARDPAAPVRLIDLTDYYTESLDAFGEEVKLGDLPRGIQRLAGTDFDVRGMIILGDTSRSENPVTGDPSRVGHIRVAQKCQRLHFLQACWDREGVEGKEVARFVIHYGDGSQRFQSMLHSRHTRGWLRSGTTGGEVTDAKLAWVGKSDPVRFSGQTFRLYKATWENPTPDVEITHLEFEAGELSIHPFIVAITAE